MSFKLYMHVSSIPKITTNINASEKSELKTINSCYCSAFKANIPIDIYRNYLSALARQNELKSFPLNETYINGLRAFRKLGDMTIEEYKGLTEYEINCIKEVADEHIYNNKKYAF